MISQNSKLIELLVRENRKYRRIFLAHNGAGPWPCIECQENVVFNTLCVHHLDGNDKNHDPLNLAPTHRSCHQRIHFEQDKDNKTENMQKMRDIRWGRPEAGAKYAATMKERGIRIPCPVCNKEFIHWHMNRHLRTQHKEYHDEVPQGL